MNAVGLKSDKNQTDFSITSNSTLCNVKKSKKRLHDDSDVSTKKIINHKLGLDCKAYFMMKLMVENGMRDKSFTPHTSCALSLFTMTSLWGR